MKFNSKKSIFVILLPALVLLGETYYFIQVRAWIGVAIVLPFIAFGAAILITTYYRVTDTILIVQCGWFSHHEIDIRKIRSVLKTRSIESAPALGFDRLAVHYQDGTERKYVIISPRHKHKLVELLKSINPQITVAI